jgi:hypothetical protein
MGTIGSGSIITASRIQGAYKWLVLCIKSHGVRDYIMDRGGPRGLGLVPSVPENKGSI